jgi:amidohydrolase
VTSPAGPNGTPAAVDAAFDEMVDTRRALHAHPELGFEEHVTTTLIRDRLGALGLTERPVATPTGGAFVLEGGRPGRTVVLRADIDALAVHEQVDVGFRSTVDGHMHACGHDAHTAVLLGAARVLTARAEELPGRYLFVFQPGEESLMGARTMVEGGLLEGLEGARVIGHHVASTLPVGLVGVRGGITMSEVHSLRITLRGAGGHGAMPTGSGDVVRAIARLVDDLGGVVAGLGYEGTDCVCTAGRLRAGSAPNVIPDHAVLEGTLRTFTADQRTEALGRLRALCDTLAADQGVTVELELPGHAPAVVNDPGLSALVAAAARARVGHERVLAMPPVAPSDDVSEFLDRLPGCYFFVGGGHPDGSSGVHHAPTFAIDEEALRVACAVTVDGALAMAAPGPGPAPGAG